MIKRCQAKDCKKKLTVVQQSLKCKCEKYFCDNHRLPESHNCTFDYKNKELTMDKLEEMRCVSAKIIKV